MSVAPVEGSRGLRGEASGGGAPGTAGVPAAAVLYQPVQGLAVGPDDIPDVGDVLEPALYLEGGGSRPGQLFQPVQEGEVLEGENGFVAQQDIAGGVLHVVAGAAGLDTAAAVGAPAGEVLAQVALAAVAHAEGSVYEALNLALGDGFGYLPDLLQAQLPGQDQLVEAQGGQPAGLFRCSDVALGGGVQLYLRDAHPQESEVLDYEGIASGFHGTEYAAAGFLQLVLEDDGVEGQIDPGAESVSVVRQYGDVSEGVARRLACPEGRSGYIHGIGTAVDGRDADVLIACRSEKL